MRQQTPRMADRAPSTDGAGSPNTTRGCTTRVAKPVAGIQLKGRLTTLVAGGGMDGKPDVQSSLTRPPGHLQEGRTHTPHLPAFPAPTGPPHVLGLRPQLLIPSPCPDPCALGPAHAAAQGLLQHHTSQPASCTTRRPVPPSIFRCGAQKDEPGQECAAPPQHVLPGTGTQPSKSAGVC